jgi:hypothetical protein
MTSFHRYLNDDRSTSFIAIDVSITSSLRELLRIIDGCMLQFHQPTYYEEASFHFSFGWDELERVPESLPHELKVAFSSLPSEPIIIDTLKIKIGNKLFEVKLKES